MVRTDRFQSEGHGVEEGLQRLCTETRDDGSIEEEQNLSLTAT